MRNLTALCCFFFFALTYAQPAPESHFDGKSWWGHIKVLAADDMEGRETGSPGLRKAEASAVRGSQACRRASAVSFRTLWLRD